ncbi:DUF6418 domain-containing protein [Alphaproteobacteria bacterium LSUCC0396]
MIYIDLNAPIFSSQLDKFLINPTGGEFFGLAMIATLLPFFFIKPLNINCYRTVKIKLIDKNAVFLIAIAFITALYADLVFKGVYPVFQGMERYEYRDQFAGPMTLFLFKYGQLIMALLGGCLVWPSLKGRGLDLKFIVPIILIFIYLFIISVRFSGYFSFFSFLVLPLGALLLRKSRKNPGVSPYLVPKKLIVSGIVIISILSGISIINSYTSRVTKNIAKIENVNEVIKDRLIERFFVQQGEMWGETFNRLFLGNVDSREEALYFMFVEPGLGGGDTGIRYLMRASLGAHLEQSLYEDGVQYAGGYPESIFEMSGAILAYPIIIILNVFFALFMIFGAKNFNKGRAYTAFFSVYVYFAMSAMYTSGTFTFLVAWTFWVKVALLALCYSIESGKLRLPQGVPN